MISIRTRLLLMLLLGLAVALTAGGAALYWIARTNLTRQFDAGLQARAHTLATLVKLEPGQLIFEASDAPAATIAETYFELHTLDGRVLKRSSNLGETSLPARQLGEHEQAIEDIELPGSLKGRALWLGFRPRVDADDWEGRDLSQVVPEVLIVAAAMDRQPIDRAMAALLTALIIVGCGVAVAAACLVGAGVRWGLIPLDRLSCHLASITGATAAKRFDEMNAPRELVPIHRELNRMLDRVQQTIERERSFSAAAAHELRTPLTELRTTAEVALRWPDSQRAGAALHEVLAIGRDMERLVESLLSISRGDATTMGDSTAIPMASIVRQCVQNADASIQAKALEVTVELDDAETFDAPHEAVEIILRNLINNAVHYTPARGTIAIRDGAANGTASLIVENGPVTLSRADLPRLFEPFWRMDSARSDREHVGLGLTIVQRIAQASGLQIQADLIADRLAIRISDKD